MRTHVRLFTPRPPRHPVPPGSMILHALTLHQPFASGLVDGLKRWETRSWPTKIRGPLAIHAGLRVDPHAVVRLRYVPDPIVTGCVLGVVHLVDCVAMTPAFIATISERERMWGDWQPGRFAWRIDTVFSFDVPPRATGGQRLWRWAVPPDYADIIRAADPAWALL